MKKAMKVMLGLVAVLVAFSMIGCGEPDLNPTYLFQEKADINAADGTVTLDKEGVTWSIKGCNNGDTDPENDLEKYDATGKIYLDGNVVKVVDGYNTNGEDVVVRVFGTSIADPYKYGWYDITLNIKGIEEKYWKVAVNNEAATTVVTSMKVNNVEQLTESKTVNDATMQAFWGSAAVIEAPEYFDIEILAENTPGTANWNNFAICMSNNIAATAWENTAILRADYYSAGWNPWSTFPSWLSKSTTNADAKVDIEGFDAGIINWDTFLADCTGNVKIKMTRTEESSAYIHFQIFVDPEKDGEYKTLYNALWVLAGINAEGQPIPGVGNPPAAGQVATGSWDFADLAAVTVDYADGATKIESAEALAAATSAGTAMPEAKFYLKGDVEYSSTTGSMKAVVKSLNEEGAPIQYNKYEATKKLGDFSVGCLQGSKDFLVVEKVQGPFTVTMNYAANSSSDKTDRYAYIKINGEENKDSAYPESVPTAGSTITVDYAGTDVVDVVFGATNIIRVYDVIFTAK